MELLTVPLRCIDLLMSHRKRFKQYTIYSGVDEQQRSFADFYAKVTSALEALPDMMEQDLSLSAVMPKKIVGTAFYTQIWRFPRSLEINYERAYAGSAIQIAGDLLFEISRCHYSRFESEPNAIKHAEFIEFDFVSRYLGNEFDIDEFEKSRSERPVTKEQKKRFLKDFNASRGK